MRLQVIEVRSGTVNLIGDVVAGPVREVLAEAGLLDHFARRIVALVAADGPARGERCLNRGNGRVPGVADGLKD